tara:strand:+ start:241 stop:567 length:327 start_codon:yes stop_codon:yes gene_type:complete
MEELLNEIENQFDIQSKQVIVVKKYYNKELTAGEAICALIRLQDQTIYKADEWFIEWVVNQLFENKLPEGSSGSFITALSDYDPVMEMERYESVPEGVITDLARYYNL